MEIYAWWIAPCWWTWNSRVQLRLGPVFGSIHFNVQRSSPYSQSQRRGMTTSGVALHRSIKPPAPACQPIIRLRIRHVPYVQVLLARIRKSERLYEQLFAYEHRIQVKASIYAPAVCIFCSSLFMLWLDKDHAHRSINA